MKKLFPIALAALLFSCYTPEAPKPTKARPPMMQSTSITLSSANWTTAKTYCNWCHQSAGTHGYSAGVELHAISGGGQIVVTNAQQWYDGIRYEKAPQGVMLPEYNRSQMLAQAIDAGATPYDVTIPTTIAWSESLQIAGASNGSDAFAPGKFRGERIEDAMQSPSLLIEDYTDRNSLTLRGVALFDQTTVPVDSFQPSHNPVNYIMPDGVAWNGRFKQFKAWGYIVNDTHSGFFFHCRTLHKGDSDQESREPRTYVMAVFSPSKFSLHSKNAPAGSIETPPWTGESETRLTAVSGYSLVRDSLNLHNDQHYWMHVEATISGGTVTYYATLSDGPGQTPFSITKATATTGDFFGGWGWRQYTTNANNHKMRISGWYVYATSVEGGGTTTGNGTTCHPPCEGDLGKADKFWEPGNFGILRYALQTRRPR
jgi:hypothetical protein